MPLVKPKKGIEVAIEETRELIMFLEKEVTGKDFFGGETIGFLDMVAGTMIPFCLVRAWECMGIDMISEEKFPGLSRWIKKLNEVEIVRECIPPKEKHIERMNKIIERSKSSKIKPTLLLIFIMNLCCIFAMLVSLDNSSVFLS